MTAPETMIQKLGRNGILALAYFVTGWLGLKLPYAGSHITLIWLPTGIALAAALRWGRGVWPGLYLGAFLVNLAIGSSWHLAATIAVGNTLAPLLSHACLSWVKFDPTFSRRKDVGLFMAGAALGMVASATLGTGSLQAAGLLPPASARSAWLSWWMGDTVGVLLAAPLLLTLNRESLRQLREAGREGLLWLLAASPVVWLTFFRPSSGTDAAPPLAFLTLPFLTWAGLRFGNTGTALAGLAFASTAAWTTALGKGVFHLPDTRYGLLILWAYMATVVLTGLLITALQAERMQVERRLRDRESLLSGLYEMSPLGIALTDMQGRFLEFNEAFLAICGYSAEELTHLDYWELTPPSFHAEEARQLDLLRRTGRYGSYEKEYLRKDGSLVPVRLNGMLIRRADGQSAIWSIVEDIRDRKQAESDLRIAATAFNSQEAMFVTDANEVILRVNQAFTKATGYSAAEVVGRTPRMFKSGRHAKAFYTDMWESILRTGGWQGEIWDRRKNGEEYPKWLTISAVRGEDGGVTHYIGAQFDITERKKVEERIAELAFYDQLTGLPNRTLLMDRLKQAMTATARHEYHGALLFIDLDHFKTLNDTLGHDMGDLLLKQVAQRLSGCTRAGDTVARLGGDEFVVVLPRLSPEPEEAARATELVGQKIIETLNLGYLLGEHPYACTASLGATMFMGGDLTIDDLMKQADLAMYRSKESGRNALRFFDPEMESVVRDRFLLEKDLRRALELGQFSLHYQAQVERGGVTGAEALLRWQHPERGSIPPSDFIPLAEETGLIQPLGRWVLEAACAQLASWSRDPQLSLLTLSVNVSPSQFRQVDFVAQVAGALERMGARPDRLKLELTEGLLVEDPGEAAEKMAVLRANGVGFALDDFGTGHSSLAHLKHMPFDSLKIDRSFVQEVLTDPNDAAIAATIVALATSLGLGVIAEGVETAEQRDFLASIGCHAYQGHLYGWPGPVGDFEALVRRG